MSVSRKSYFLPGIANQTPHTQHPFPHFRLSKELFHCKKPYEAMLYNKKLRDERLHVLLVHTHTKKIISAVYAMIEEAAKEIIFERNAIKILPRTYFALNKKNTKSTAQEMSSESCFMMAMLFIAVCE